MHLSPRFGAVVAAWLISSCLPLRAEINPVSKPNIVVILADDLGYGDVQSLNPRGKIPTPHLDRLAAQGMIFTDAHSGSSVCTPTRYGLLTGRYAWRSRLKKGVQGGMSPRLIEPGRLTVAQFLKNHGYHTACVGKWHLGMDWTLKAGAPPFTDAIEKGEAGWNADFSAPIRNGPNTLGFDTFFGLGGSLDMVPYTFVDQQHVVAQPTVDKAFPMMPGRGNSLTRRGPAAETFEASDVLPTLTRKAIDFIEARAPNAAASPSREPFFLYLPLASPHTPVVPAREWQGKSGLNPYADFVMQTDAAVGEVLAALERTGLANSTLVMFTSDNGCSPQAGLKDLEASGHFPSAHFRGAKADIFEGGHRIPFIARWPGQIAAGARCDQLISLNDLLATCAHLLGDKLPDNAAEDSVSFLPALRGIGTPPSRNTIVHHSINGSFAIREGSWKLALCSGSGGWSAPRPGSAEENGLPILQLYDLNTDPGERRNVQAEHPETVTRLRKLLAKFVADGRSTPGAPQPNTGDVQIETAAVDRAPRRPNIILVMTDDQGYGDLACHGNPIIQTPHLDRLHRESVRFTNFHVSPTCAPTRSALLTGRHEFRNGVTHTILERERLTLNATTLAELLRTAGYATGIFGKWHLGDETPYQPDRRGFDEVFIHGGGGIGQTYPGSCGDAPGNRYFDPTILHNGAFEKTSGYCTDVFFGHAIEWMDEKLDAGSPFFCYLTPNAPHEPLHLPEEYARPYAGKVPENVAKFYGMITNIDENVGRLLAKLEEWGIAENTLVIFMTDNGSATGSQIFNAGMRGRKGTPFEGGTRVPAFWRWPASWKGGVDVAGLTAHIDVVPTLAEIAGISLNEKLRAQIEGRSLLPLLRNPSDPWTDRFLFTHVGRWERGQAAASKFAKCAVRNSRFALVNNTELYDLTNDPGQTRNIIAEQPPVLTALRTAYDQWWTEILPALCNEEARGPALNPFKERYWKQFGGGPP